MKKNSVLQMSFSASKSFMMVILRPIVFALAVVLGFCGDARAAESNDAAANDASEIILVLGAEGAPEFGEQFGIWATTWQDIADKAAATLTSVGRAAEDQKTDRELLQAAVQKIPVDRTMPTWIVLIGHGTYSQKTAKFNLRGPDVSAQELAQWLKPVQSPVVIVNCASSSAPFINQLSGKNRVIVTATKSGTQYNFARFGKFFAAAIASTDSDLDHDDEVSVQEAFLRASNDVKNFYASQDRIATEQALIDDNADAKGTPAKMFRGVRAVAKAKEGAVLDGKFAAKISLPVNGRGLQLTLQERQLRDQMETQLEGMRSKKAELPREEYMALIEPVLLQLAKIYQDAERRQAQSSEP